MHGKGVLICLITWEDIKAKCPDGNDYKNGYGIVQDGMW